MSNNVKAKLTVYDDISLLNDSNISVNEIFNNTKDFLEHSKSLLVNDFVNHLKFLTQTNVLSDELLEHLFIIYSEWLLVLSLNDSELTINQHAIIESFRNNHITFEIALKSLFEFDYGINSLRTAIDELSSVSKARFINHVIQNLKSITQEFIDPKDSVQSIKCYANLLKKNLK